MIRLLLMIPYAIIIIVLSLILLPLEWVIGKINQDAKDISSLRFVQFVFRGVLFISGTKTTVIGLENVPKDEAVVYIGNHHGFFDVLVTYILMKDKTGYIAKKETGKVPILHRWMVYLYCLFLDRDNGREGLKCILKGVEQLKNGISMVIFPEGTRNKSTDGTLPFHAGSFKLAEKSGCKIIPMVINNTAACFEDHFPLIKKTHVIVEFCEPIVLKELAPEDKKNIAEYTRNIITERYEKNKSLI
ncbi:MAG: lysophospholipid acyltransferase family protein [Lachnospira sp.]